LKVIYLLKFIDFLGLDILPITDEFKLSLFLVMMGARLYKALLTLRFYSPYIPIAVLRELIPPLKVFECMAIY
jgi:hypothetical protein